MPTHNKDRKFPAEILTEQEVERLLMQLSTRYPTGIRNRALIAVLYRAGLRLDEALSLHAANVDFVNGSVRVLHGKGDKARTVGIDSGAVAMINLWLVEWLKIAASEPLSRGAVPLPIRLFCTLGGRPMRSGYVRTLLPRLGSRAGITKRVHAHGLRHTHAAELAAEGFPTNVIQAQLGHSSLATTDTYLKHIAPEELIERMRGREWKGRHVDQ